MWRSVVDRASVVNLSVDFEHEWDFFGVAKVGVYNPRIALDRLELSVVFKVIISKLMEAPSKGGASVRKLCR
ncbi:MAG: hypothetical protein HC902_02515 [Calothrix sp. SM1_5_4]|nr:hypothetical protein [Calothrix sp. SM1_5_4]